MQNSIEKYMIFKLSQVLIIESSILPLENQNLFTKKSEVTMKTKISRQIFLILTDILAINISFLFALYIHFEGNIPHDVMIVYSESIIIITIIKLLVYKYFELYDSLWAYASVEELIKVVTAGLVANILSISYLLFMGLNYILVFI